MMMARLRPRFEPVKFPNFRAPSRVKEKLMAGWLNSSIVGRALRKSRPVTGATRRTK